MLELPSWYQPTASGGNEMDRVVDYGFPLVPTKVEIRDEGIAWSFDPSGEIPRLDAHLGSASNLLDQLSRCIGLFHERRFRSNSISEQDRVFLLRQGKYYMSRTGYARTVLADFLELQRKRPEATLEYAKRHGVLDICDHGLTHGHHPSCAPAGWPFDGWTSFDAWRKTAERLAAILRISSELKEDQHSLGRKEDWAVLFSSVQNNKVRDSLRVLDREHAFNLLGSIVNDYLRIAEVVPIVARRPSGWKMQQTGNTLYPLLGNLIAQVSLIICGAEAMYTCSGCGTLYCREAGRRRPKFGSANYCSSCGTPQAVRDAKARYRAKKKEARYLRANHVSLREIASRLESHVENVRKWVAK
jgi:hypothetical protein